MIAVSFLKSLYSRSETIKKIDESESDLIHVDLLDGIYAGINNLDIDELIKDLANTKKKLDIHLMIKEPLEIIKKLIDLNIWAITFHLDATTSPIEIIEYVKKHNIKVGIAINPDEDIHVLDKYFNLIQYVLIMSVVPGKGGQEFIPKVLEKIPYLYNKNVLIGIDGGINNKTVNYLRSYQIDNIVSGSFVCMNDDFNEAIESLKK